MKAEKCTWDEFEVSERSYYQTSCGDSILQVEPQNSEVDTTAPHDELPKSSPTPYGNANQNRQRLKFLLLFLSS